MKSSLAILIAFFIFRPAIAEDNPGPSNEVILPASPPQKIFRRFQTDFDYHHDRGFYFSTTLGPQWNHSIDLPNAKGVRFGGKVNVGFFAADGFALFASAWGNFLEAASLIAVGPGASFLFSSTNMTIDLSLGLGRAFNPIQRDNIKDFAETLLATHLAVGKYWWLSSKTSLGISLSAGFHGFSLAEGRLNSFGWNSGLGLAFLFG